MQVKPILYDNLHPVGALRHQGKRLFDTGNYAFTRNAGAVPITFWELPEAVRSAPVVFLLGDEPGIVALLGLEKAQNVFVDKNGRWAPHAYMPAYIRRHPFIFAKRDENQYALWVDESSDRLNDDQGEKLYEDGQPTEALQQAIDFCTAYHKQIERTKRIVRQIAETGILEDRRIRVTVDGETEYALGGFQTVKEDSLRELDDDTLLKWHGNGWLQGCYAHLLSLRNLKILGELSKQR